MSAAPSPRSQAPSREAAFAWAMTALFVAVTVPRLWLHELWRDEAWLWLVARESDSLRALAEPLGRSGQGYLFPLLCFAVSRAVASWRAMQALNLAIAAAACHLFARRAPLSRPQRALFVLGYFPAWEYAVLSRHYALGMLLAWLACAATAARRPALGVAVALALLCQTTVYGWLLAMAIAAGWTVDRRHRRRRGEALPAIARGEAAVAVAIALAGAVAGLVQLVPAPGTSFAPGWHFGWDPALAASVARIPWRVLVPLFAPGLHFWNTNLLDARPALESAAGVAALAVALALVARRPAALATFAVGTAGLLAFAYVKYVGVARHHGHLWLLLGAALWLGGGVGATSRAEERGGPRRGWRAPLLTALLALQVVASGWASAIDLGHPFSNGGAAAAAIRGGDLARLPLLGYREPPTASVALALGRALWAPSRRRFATRPDWGPEQRDLAPAELRCAARDFAALERSDVGLVVNAPLPAWPELEPVAATTGAIVASEDYWLYRLRADRLDATAAGTACATPAAAAAGR